MASSVADLIQVDFFLPVCTSEGAVYIIPLRTVEDLVARLQGVVTNVDSNMLRRARDNAMGCTAVCLEMDGGLFDHPLSTIWSFDSLSHLTMMCILKTKGHRKYGVQYLRLC
jgi:hypothetical protein